MRQFIRSWIKKEFTKKIVLGSLLGFSLLSVSSIRASHALDFSVMGGASLSSLSQASQLSASNSSSFGVGATALLGLDLIPFFSLEGGLMLMNHRVGLTDVAGTPLDGSVSFNNLTLPVMLRFQPIPFFAVEAGGYFGLASNSTVSLDDVGSIPSFSTNKDNGLIGGVSLLMPVLPLIKFRTAVFYEYGLANLATTGNEIKARNINLYLGLMLDI